MLVFIRDAGKFLLAAILGAIAGASVFVFLIVWAMQQRGIEYIGKREVKEESYLIISAIIWIAILVFGVIFRRKLLLSISPAIVIVLLTSGYVLVSAYIQQRDVKNALEYRKSKGLPYKLDELFPRASTQKQCRTWLKSARLEHTQGEVFLGSLIINFWDVTSEPLRHGKSLDEAIVKADSMARPEWKKIFAYNKAGIEAMKKCPYLQWFDASNFEQSYETGGYTSERIDMFYWARSMEGQALILAKNGQTEEAKKLLYTLREAIDKLIIPGQELSLSLIAMAMDNLAATGFISIQVLGGQPFSEEDLSRISSFSKILTSRIIYLYAALCTDCEKLCIMADCIRNGLYISIL
ncbi:MAG: hypothetical protein A2Y62_14540 [Candidatus Fischerbacteria bacterium RBG_13_37_8]|uniref:Uncharacterized protein n=1 Tax=Candidatus Fischerbacteria bacterium RBG_13_37_8 TaxID=1817863 RepID=A0A1F5V5C8_9BACT|nr:MAG: hypothetical protein A2Y62_14540 [Candidatus Fischerbacteria bacterium RBG_13_37_8]